MDERERYWTDYYRRLVDAPDWLDYSNEQVQAQTFGLALASGGPLANRRCLDFGCGGGRFSVGLAAFGAEVSGLDLVPEFIQRNAKRHPGIRWFVGTLPDPALEAELGAFDAVFALEVLQLMPFRSTMETLWRLVQRGGRVVVLVPNRLCPIITGVVTRFHGQYQPPTPDEVRQVVSSLPDLEAWHFRGMMFREDQRIVPYDLTQWTTTGDWETQPNRFLIVARKRA